MSYFKLIKLIFSMFFIMGFINAQIEGSWKVSPEAGALMVGPSAGSGSWWSNSEADVTTRSCYFNDEYVFNADGSFTNDLGAETWIESWQGGGSDACGVPVAPHDGLNPATWSYDGSSITLDGTGAYLGLSKVYNGGELESPDNAPVSITYDITFSDNDETMNLSIFVGPAWWSFKLVTSASIPEDPCADISCGPGETCVDGVCVELQDVNVTFNLDMSSVTTSPDGAFLAGGGTFGNPGDYPMIDDDGDDIWTITVTLPENSATDYSFTNGNCPSWSCKENISGQDCAVPPWSDRHIEVGTEDVIVNACFALCGDGSCDELEELPTVDVTFQVNMSMEAVNPEGVYVAGGGLGEEGYIMEDSDGDNIYTVVIPLLPDNTYQYKFRNSPGDGNYGGVWEVVPEECSVGEFLDRWVDVGSEDLVIDPVDFGSCFTDPCIDVFCWPGQMCVDGDCVLDPCYDITCDAGLECVDGACVEDLTHSVYFSIDLNNSVYPNSDYESVVINGDWNNWAGWGVTLADADGDGVYTGFLEGLADSTTVEYVIACTGEADSNSGWGVPFNPPLGSECDFNPGDEYANYGFTIDGADVNAVYCAGSCEETCALSNDISLLPDVFNLSNAHPNPFNPITSFTLNVSEPGYVSVQVYNIQGQVEATLVSGYMNANSYNLRWNASEASSGMYVVTAESVGYVSTQKILLIK